MFNKNNLLKLNNVCQSEWFMSLLSFKMTY